MTDAFTQTSGSLAGQLTAACGAGELAAAAAIDAEEGDKFLHARLADQMAGAHLLTMRMAALADRAITAAAEGAGQGMDNRPLFDLAAARFAGAAARLNGRYCRALQTLRTLAGPAAEEDEIEWVGVNFPAYGPYEMTPEERARRINREKFYRRFNYPIEEPDDKPARRRVNADEQARLGAAECAARVLLTDAGVDTLAGTSNAQRTTLFAHQLAATHRLTMRLTGRADSVIAASVDALDRPEGLRLAHGAARLMERFRQGVAMLRRVRTPTGRPRRVRNFWAGYISEADREEERAEDIANGLDPDTGLPIEPSLGAKAGLSAEAPLGAKAGGSAPILLRRGRLNNGNPGGDFLAAPRCGAKTRAGCACRQPAMANGRCRFHGGKSTGARTADGLARVRNARLVHGLRSAEVIAISAAAAAAHRSLGVLIAAFGRQRTEDRGQKASRSGTPLNPAMPDVPVRTLCHPSSVLRPLAPAGHGVDRSESNMAAGGAVVLPFARSQSRASWPVPPRDRAKSARSSRRSGIPRVQP